MRNIFNFIEKLKYQIITLGCTYLGCQEILKLSNDIRNDIEDFSFSSSIYNFFFI